MTSGSVFRSGCQHIQTTPGVSLDLGEAVLPHSPGDSRLREAVTGEAYPHGLHIAATRAVCRVPNHQGPPASASTQERSRVAHHHIFDPPVDLYTCTYGKKSCDTNDPRLQARSQRPTHGQGNAGRSRGKKVTNNKRSKSRDTQRFNNQEYDRESERHRSL